MAVSTESILYLFLVSLLWGTTNPFIKKGSQGLKNVKASSKLGQCFQEVLFFITNLKCMIPFLVNQAGSVVYFLTLGSTDISFAVPVTNSLTFVTTAITDWALGEERISRKTYMGMILILVGLVLCSWDKINKVV